MNIDEIEALKIALEQAGNQNSALISEIWIELNNETWEVGSMPERVIRIDSDSGKVLSNSNFLNAIEAFTIAKEYAAANFLNWRPGFSLALDDKCWNVSSCQSQLGGQVYIHVAHNGEVIKHFVNPK